NEQEQNWVINAVAHRIVHGGELFTSSVLLNEEIINKLKQLNCLAPLHQPHNLAAVEIIKKSHPQLAQIACFDTAFHADHSPFFTTYALPQTIRSQGVRRYGFHGLSYEWIVEVLKHQYPEIASKRIIAAHLGNGSSLCAIHHGLSIDTTMGLTALDGVPMGSRSGSIDPGAIIYMIRNLNLSPDNVEQILYNQSGLLGLSGQTNDVQQLEENKGVNAQFALDFFCLKTAQFIAMMAISLGGVDGIVFTGGIGENSEKIRSSILEKIECLKPFSVYIIPANEEKMMAMHALNILAI
ncbi:MAG: acetate/propionate family kinase, partial [bacterium]|nr:acetate/propionate family kinase [bacterium]